jgi:CRISPR system Cascade subunit CasA
VVDIAATRADLQGAAWQFLIGLLQCAVAPKNRNGWEDTWEEGLSAETLVAALAPLEAAFQFGPDTPSFMQDFDSLAGDKVSIASCYRRSPARRPLNSIKTILSNVA